MADEFDCCMGNEAGTDHASFCDILIYREERRAAQLVKEQAERIKELEAEVAALVAKNAALWKQLAPYLPSI